MPFCSQGAHRSGHPRYEISLLKTNGYYTGLCGMSRLIIIGGRRPAVRRGVRHRRSTRPGRRVDSGSCSPNRIGRGLVRWAGVEICPAPWTRFPIALEPNRLGALGTPIPEIQKKHVQTSRGVFFERKEHACGRILGHTKVKSTRTS